MAQHRVEASVLGFTERRGCAPTAATWTPDKGRQGTMRQAYRAFIGRVDRDGLAHAVSAALNWLDWRQLVPLNARVFIKPNFAYPLYTPGVTTSPDMIDVVVGVLRERTRHILIGESDGSAGAWTAEVAFAGHDVSRICSLHDVRAVNLSRLPREIARVMVAGREERVELPSLLIHDVDVFLTLPVPKVHALTGVSLGFKNQWGCLPDAKRLRHHHALARKLVAINSVLRPKIAIFDGLYFLDRGGPVHGDPVRMDLVIASIGPGPGTLVCCKVMQVEPLHIPHLRLLTREGLMPSSIDEVALNDDVARFRTAAFSVRRSAVNWLALAAFHSRFATTLLYDSPLAAPAHALLYRLRGRLPNFVPHW